MFLGFRGLWEGGFWVCLRNSEFGFIWEFPKIGDPLRVPLRDL